MTRNRIPPVRRWRVRYYNANGVKRGDVIVATINKQFARWEAKDFLMAQGQLRILLDADKVTVTLADRSPKNVV